MGLNDMIFLYAGDNNTGVFTGVDGRRIAEAPKEVVEEASHMMMVQHRYENVALKQAGIENVFVPSIRHIITAAQNCRERIKGK